MRFPPATTTSICTVLLLSACATGPDGRRHYIGPKIRGAITYRGLGVELTLFDPLNPEDTRTIDLTPGRGSAGGGGKQPLTP